MAKETIGENVRNTTTKLIGAYFSAKMDVSSMPV
jgi:hypothetical protein